MSVMSSLGNDIIGNPKKAFLIIHSNASEDIDTAKMSARTESVLEMATVGNTVSLTASTLAASMLAHGVTDLSILRVQYNPSSISFACNADEIAVRYLQAEHTEGMLPIQQCRPPSVVMSVDLIFDAVNTKDAFMFEKFRLSATDIAGNIAGAITRREYSVQPHTNALIAMIMRNSTRFVTFKWADLTFTGEVTEISAQYTMFSVSGKPIRSVVHMNITQEVGSTADESYWNKAFDSCFGNSLQTKSSGGKSLRDTFGNLVGLGL